MPIERGTASLEAILLKLARSAQSGLKTMTGAYASIYTDSDSYAYIFAMGTIDLTNMAAGDIVWVRLSRMDAAAASYVIEDERVYTGVQPSNAKKIPISAFSNRYGSKIEAYQSAGTLRDLYCEFFVAKR